MTKPQSNLIWFSSKYWSGERSRYHQIRTKSKLICRMHHLEFNSEEPRQEQRKQGVRESNPFSWERRWHNISSVPAPIYPFKGCCLILALGRENRPSGVVCMPRTLIRFPHLPKPCCTLRCMSAQNLSRILSGRWLAINSAETFSHTYLYTNISIRPAIIFQIIDC